MTSAAGADAPAPSAAGAHDPGPSAGGAGAPAPGTVVLRPLTRDDLGRVMELEPALFGLGAWSRGVYEEELRTPGRTYVAATDGDDLVGYAGLAAGEEAQVMTVGVHPAHRRRGIGARLVGALLDAAGHDGSRTVLLEVRASDEGAQRLYERAGFRRIGIRRNYYAAEGEDAVVMRARLTGTGPIGSEVP